LRSPVGFVVVSLAPMSLQHLIGLAHKGLGMGDALAKRPLAFLNFCGLLPAKGGATFLLWHSA